MMPAFISLTPLCILYKPYIYAPVCTQQAPEPRCNQQKSATSILQPLSIPSFPATIFPAAAQVSHLPFPKPWLSYYKCAFMCPFGFSCVGFFPNSFYTLLRKSSLTSNPTTLCGYINICKLKGPSTGSFLGTLYAHIHRR